MSYSVKRRWYGFSSRMIGASSGLPQRIADRLRLRQVANALQYHGELVAAGACKRASGLPSVPSRECTCAKGVVDFGSTQSVGTGSRLGSR
jgi:hypothetical protein